MNRVCGVPRCPHVFESGPNRVFCDVHTEEHFVKHSNLEAEYADEVEGALDNMLYDARSDLRRLNGKQGEEGSWHRYVAEQVEMYIPALQTAVEEDEIWTAVHHALWVGLMVGHGRGAPDQHALKSLKSLMALKREQFADGGRATRKAPSDGDLCADVEKKMRDHTPHLSWTDACRQIGNECEPKIDGRTVRNRTRDHCQRLGLIDNKSGNR